MPQAQLKALARWLEALPEGEHQTPAPPYLHQALQVMYLVQVYPVNLRVV